MKYYVYIIRCADDTLYTGYATDVEKRLSEHNGEGPGAGAKYTRGRRPVELVHQEAFKTRGEAMSRECAIKSLKRDEKEALIKANKQTLKSKKKRKTNT